MTTSWVETKPSSLLLSDVLVGERYLPDGNPLRADTLTQLLNAEYGRLRHALFLPADETYFAVFDGTAPNTASSVGRSHDLLDRIVSAVLLVPARRSA